MKTIILLLLFCSLANAETPKKFESEIKASLNDPESLKIDSMFIYKHEDGSVAACGKLRAKNAYGGVVRANFVVDKQRELVYVGDIPYEEFKLSCKGEVVN